MKENCAAANRGRRRRVYTHQWAARARRELLALPRAAGGLDSARHGRRRTAAAGGNHAVGGRSRARLRSGPRIGDAGRTRRCLPVRRLLGASVPPNGRSFTGRLNRRGVGYHQPRGCRSGDHRRISPRRGTGSDCGHSGISAPDDIAAAKAAGIAAVVSKPFLLPDLHGQLAAVFALPPRFNRSLRPPLRLGGRISRRHWAS